MFTITQVSSLRANIERHRALSVNIPSISTRRRHPWSNIDARPQIFSRRFAETVDGRPISMAKRIPDNAQEHATNFIERLCATSPPPMVCEVLNRVCAQHRPMVACASCSSSCRPSAVASPQCTRYRAARGFTPPECVCAHAAATSAWARKSSPSRQETAQNKARSGRYVRPCTALGEYGREKTCRGDVSLARSMRTCTWTLVRPRPAMTANPPCSEPNESCTHERGEKRGHVRVDQYLSDITVSRLWVVTVNPWVCMRGCGCRRGE